MINILHEMEPWLIKLTKNAQKPGIILNPESPEVMAPMATDLTVQASYDWCR